MKYENAPDQQEIQEAIMIDAQAEMRNRIEALDQQEFELAELQSEAEEMEFRQQDLAETLADLEQQVAEQNESTQVLSENIDQHEVKLEVEQKQSAELDESLPQLNRRLQEEEQRSLELIEEQQTLERLVELLGRVKNDLSDHLQLLEDPHIQLATAFQKAEAQIDSCSMTLGQEIETLESSRTELTECLSQLQQHVSEQLHSQLTATTTNVEMAYSTFHQSSEHEKQKLEEEFTTKQAAFSELTTTVTTSHETIETGQNDYQHALQQITHQFTGWSGDVYECQRQTETVVGEIGEALINDLLARLSRELSVMDASIYQESWSSLQNGYSELKSNAEHLLNTFGSNVFSAGTELGQNISEIISHIVNHAQSEVKDRLEDAVRDIFDNGVDVIIEEVKEQLIEAAAGLAMSAALPALAPVMAGARAALKAVDAAENAIDSITPW